MNKKVYHTAVCVCCFRCHLQTLTIDDLERRDIIHTKHARQQHFRFQNSKSARGCPAPAGLALNGRKFWNAGTSCPSALTAGAFGMLELPDI